MGDKVKNEMARMLSEWLFKDFGILIEAPTKEEIVKTLEKSGEDK